LNRLPGHFFSFLDFFIFFISLCLIYTFPVKSTIRERRRTWRLLKIHLHEDLAWTEIPSSAMFVIARVRVLEEPVFNPESETCSLFFQQAQLIVAHDQNGPSRFGLTCRRRWLDAVRKIGHKLRIPLRGARCW
jgi:hypothetical protein